jgi:hypothetical protein
MDAASVSRIEKNVERGASALFGLACGFAAYCWFAAGTRQPVLGLETATACAFTYLLSARLLRAVQPKPRRLPVPVFDVREVEPMPSMDERLQRVRASAESRPERSETVEPPAQSDVLELSQEEPMLLDDVVEHPEPDSRVVRLFDPDSMPSAADLKSRIDRHLADERSAAQSADAAQALHDALAELRRAMR